MFVSSIAQAPLRRFCIILACQVAAACSPAGREANVTPESPPDFVGSTACRTCHETEFGSWRKSHHALAMQDATAATVLGNFSDVDFEHYGTTTTFYQRDGNYYVRTDNEQGDPGEFPVSYTFGVTPLQQYLVEFPGGRLQTLPVAWDSRPADEGGERWFHIYPDERIDYTDALHWTGREQNWNYMCAECHSTNLDKNYDGDSNSFATSWSEINVGCEACHGPASRHLIQAERGSFQSRLGLLTDLDDAGRAVWEMNPETGIAARSEFRMRPPVQPEACGRCHSRRAVAAAGYEFDKPLLDTHTPSLLDEGLYFPDGQILDEVYVYGSFVQSRMYQAGVSCSDCHEPHSGALRTGGDPSNVCSTCHLPAKFATADHNRHPAGAASCVDCHMASRDYMVVDGRRDHSFRIPRPDLTVATGSPNACNQCHQDKDADWAATVFTDWFGDDSPAHYGFAIHAGRSGGGNQPLLGAIDNAGFPGIARGTALSLLRPPYSQQVAEVIRGSLQSADPFVRLGALRALPGLQQDLQVDWATPLLSDRLRSIRIDAARIISPLRGVLPVRFEETFNIAEQELKDAALAISERPEAHVNLGNVHIEAGEPALGEAAFQQALLLDPDAVSARVNLADLYRRLDRDEDAEALLREGIAANPDEAAYRHSIGLLLVRQDRSDDALAELENAANLQANNARYAYVYAVALNSMGRAEAATEYLDGVRADFPGDFDIHWALATMLRDQGRNDESRAVASALADIYPGNQPLEILINSL